MFCGNTLWQYFTVSPNKYTLQQKLINFKSSAKNTDRGIRIDIWDSDYDRREQTSQIVNNELHNSKNPFLFFKIIEMVFIETLNNQKNCFMINDVNNDSIKRTSIYNTIAARCTRKCKYSKTVNRKTYFCSGSGLMVRYFYFHDEAKPISVTPILLNNEISRKIKLS